MYIRYRKIPDMRPPLFLFLIILMLVLPLSQSSCKQQASVRQKQIDRNREKQQAKARKAYEMDLKKHHKSQSKETRAMMKRSRRKSRQNTPLKK